jgi:hypothetical protein
MYTKQDKDRYDYILEYLTMWGWQLKDNLDASYGEWSFENCDGLIVNSVDIEHIFAFADGHYKGRAHCKHLVSHH